MIDISLQNLNISYGKEDIISNVNLTFIKEKMTSIIGPNGSGKSTLLKAISGIIKTNQGKILINHKLINSYNKKNLAQKISSLPQSPESPKDITVRQLVSYGRYAYQSLFKKNKIENEKMVEWALKVTGLNELSEHYMDELSGGQKQRAWIAMSIAQNSDCLFLDELTTYLDIKHQLEILELLKNLNKKEKKTIIMVHHDLNHAIRYSDYIVIIKKGKIIAHENIETIIKNKVLNDVFQVNFKILRDEKNNPIIFSDGILN